MKKFNKYGANHLNKCNTSTYPSWFQASKYEEGDVVSNPFTGKSCKLNAVELSMYDYIKGLEWYLSANGWKDVQRAKTFEKALNWFRDNNPTAYYILLD